MNFSDIIGHKKNIELLKSFSVSGRRPHALLFTGLDGLGKRKTAVVFAAALSCLEPGEDGACGRCSSCIGIKNRIHPGINFVVSLKNYEKDIVEIDFSDRNLFINNIVPSRVNRNSDKTSSDSEEQSSDEGAGRTVKLNIRQIRELKRHCYLKSPSGYGTKVFIIDDASQLSRPAMNSLLKILEEPPPDTHIILITSREEALLPTIVSRCQRVDFGPLNRAEMEEFTQLYGIEASEELIEISSGSPGKLLKFKDMGDFDIPPLQAEQVFDAAGKWADKDRGKCLNKMSALLEKEAAFFRKNPDKQNYTKVALIQDAIDALEKNSNIDLTVSCMFLKLAGLDSQEF